MRMRSRTALISTVAGGLLLLVATYGAYLAASSVVKGAVAGVLGPRGETRDVRVGLGGLVLEGVRVRAPERWPADDTIRAERVSIAPRLLTLVSGDVIRI